MYFGMAFGINRRVVMLDYCSSGSTAILRLPPDKKGLYFRVRFPNHALQTAL
jgi:hypothetical protein